MSEITFFNIRNQRVLSPQPIKLNDFKLRNDLSPLQNIAQSSSYLEKICFGDGKNQNDYKEQSNVIVNSKKRNNIIVNYFVILFFSEK